MYKIEKGSQVKYAKAFLKSIHAGVTDELWFARGIVTDLQVLSKDLQIATISGFPLREDGTLARVNVKNLARIDDIARLNLPD